MCMSRHQTCSVITIQVKILLKIKHGVSKNTAITVNYANYFVQLCGNDHPPRLWQPYTLRIRVQVQTSCCIKGTTQSILNNVIVDLLLYFKWHTLQLLRFRAIIWHWKCYVTAKLTAVLWLVNTACNWMGIYIFQRLSWTRASTTLALVWKPNTHRSCHRKKFTHKENHLRKWPIQRLQSGCLFVSLKMPAFKQKSETALKRKLIRDICNVLARKVLLRHSNKNLAWVFFHQSNVLTPC